MVGYYVNRGRQIKHDIMKKERLAKTIPQATMNAQSLVIKKSNIRGFASAGEGKRLH